MLKEEFEKKWLNTFVPSLTKAQYRQCHVDCYLWHVFSYGLIPKDKVLSGDSAREAYEKVNKEGAVTFHLWDDENGTQTSIIKEEYKSWKKLDSTPEFYVVDKDWKWTYMSTHENDCMGLGPFFYQKDC